MDVWGEDLCVCKYAVFIHTSIKRRSPWIIHNVPDEQFAEEGHRDGKVKWNRDALWYNRQMKYGIYGIGILQDKKLSSGGTVLALHRPAERSKQWTALKKEKEERK